MANGNKEKDIKSASAKSGLLKKLGIKKGATNAYTSKGSSGSSVLGDRKKIISRKSSFYTLEAYKTLRTNVNFALADNEGCKVLLVTSALQSEGKSITTLNLAISLAEAGNRVLVLDCDLRRPKLATLVEISSENGLSDLLIHPELSDEVVQKFRNMDMIFAGHIPPNPSELLGSARMEKLVKNMRAKYDYIVLDTPPVNMVTDAAVAANWVDGVLFVVRAGRSERGAVIHAVEQLEYSKAKILGFILNGINADGAGYSNYKYKRYGRYSYNRYGKRYGYGGYGKGYNNYGYNSGYGYDKGYGYGHGGYGKGYGYGYGYGYGNTEKSALREEAYNAVANAAKEAREDAESDKK